MQNRQVGWLLIMTLIACVRGQGVDRQSRCDWQLDLVSRNLGILTRYVTPDASLYQDVTVLISNVDLTPDDSTVSDEQAYVVQGGTPVISVYYPPQTTFDQTPVGPVVRELYGALVDTAASESIEVNSPAWVVPLPLDSCHSVLGVNTRGEGGGEILPNTKSFEVLIASLTDFTGRPDPTYLGPEVSTPSSLATYLNGPKPPPNFVPVYNSGFVYGPLDTNGNYMFAYRDFSDVTDAKFLFNPDMVAGLGVCTCHTAATHPRLLAALPQRVLMYGRSGLREVRGNFVHMHSTDNNIIKQNSITSSLVDTSTCLSQLIVNSQIDLLQEWTAVGLGDCSDKNKLYVAEVKHTLDAPLNLEELKDLNLAVHCRAACDLVTAVVWAEGISKITVLVKSDTNQEYYLIDYTRDRFNNSGTSEITATIAFDQQENPSLGEAVVLSLEGTKQTGLTSGTAVTLSLTGLSLRPYSSNDIFIWGNRILYSPDRGKTVLLLPWPPTAGATNLQVRSLPVSQSGMFAALVSDSTPPDGDNPTQIWIGYTSLPTEMYQVYETNDFHVLMHHESSDRNGYSWQPDTILVSIWWQQDIYQEDKLKLLGYSPSQTTGLSGIQNLEVSAYRLVEMVRDSLRQHVDIVPVTTELVYADERPDKCPVDNIVFEIPAQINTLKLQELTYKPPRAFDGANETILYTGASILAYHSVVIYLDQLQDAAITSSYLNTDYDDTTEQWQGEMASSVAYRDYTFQYGAALGGFDIDIDDYTKNYPHFEDGSKPQITQLPDNIYLGHKETFSFLVHFIMKDFYHFWAYSTQGLTVDGYTDSYNQLFYNEDFDIKGNDNSLSVSVTDQNLINVTKELVADESGDILTYKITIADKGQMGLSTPGANLVPVGLQLVAHNSPFRCYTDYTQFGRTPLGIQRTNVIVGCAPQLRIQFDAFATVKEVDDASGGKYFDCPINPDPKMPCFYFSTEFLPRFRIQDLLTGSSKPYNGKYSLRVIGGSGKSINDIEHFSEDQIFQYNNKNAKGSGLIFGHSSGQYTEDGWPLFTEGTQSVVWLCLSESPCADVNPKFPMPPEYFFLVRFSNIGTGEDTTNCILQLDFVVRVHGLPINFYKKSLPTFLITMFVMFAYIMLYYVCHRDDDRVFNIVRAKIDAWHERISPKKEIDEAFLAEHRANYQKRKLIAKNVTAVRRPGETIELGLSYQGLSFLRAAHANATGDARLPDLKEEDEDDDVLIPAATMDSPYLTSFALSSQPMGATTQGADSKFNPMKGKAKDVSVRKKELFVEAEELVQRSFHSGLTLTQEVMRSDQEIEKDIIRPKKTPEVTVEDEGGEQLLNVIEPSPEGSTVQTRKVIGPDGKTVKTIRRVSRTVKIPKSELHALSAQHRNVVRRIVKKKSKEGQEKIEETALPNQSLDNAVERQHSETIVNMAVEGAKKALSEESLNEK